MTGDCGGILEAGHQISGVYQIQPDGFAKAFDVFCDMDTDGGGWTVRVLAPQNCIYPSVLDLLTGICNNTQLKKYVLLGFVIHWLRKTKQNKTKQKNLTIVDDRLTYNKLRLRSYQLTLVLLRVFPKHIFLRGGCCNPLGLSILKVI